MASSLGVSLGGEVGMAAGPLGRTLGGSANTGIGSDGSNNGNIQNGAGFSSASSEGRFLAPAYSYSHSKGLFAGVSLEGGVVCSRSDINAKFYGRPVTTKEILNDSGRHRAVEPLYEALEGALQMECVGWRPTETITQLKG